MAETTAITAQQLAAHQETATALLAESGRVHDLVSERVDALDAACNRADDWHPLENKRSFVERVLAKGQHPFPKGVSLYDDGNSNTVYGQVEVVYGDVTYSGSWADWSEDGESYARRPARISVPAYVLTDPDGPDRYRAETRAMVAQVHADQAAEDALISRLVEEAVAERGASA